MKYEKHICKNAIDLDDFTEIYRQEEPHWVEMLIKIRYVSIYEQPNINESIVSFFKG